jgi:integrase
LVKLLEEGKITQEDADLMEVYLRERRHNHNLQISTQNKIFFSLLAWRKESPPFKDITINDVYATLERLTGSEGNDALYSKNTVNSIYGNVRPFLLWLIAEGHNPHLPEKKLLAIKRPSAETMTKKAADMLTIEEIENMVRVCATSRDRALIMMLYEGGFRIGEIGALTWGDIKFDDLGVVVNTNKKTMKPRYIRLTMSREYLAAWKNDYPFSPDPDAVVFLTNRKEPITYESIRKQIG